MENKTNVLDWYGLYAEGWGDELVPEALAHPAKFRRALIRKIYAHLIERGWLREGDTVLDPFGGVALGALDAMLNGLNWVGVELEPRFVELGRKNIELWHKRYGGRFARWGTAHIQQGDSRKLLTVLRGEPEAVVTSPPFTDVGLSHRNFTAPHDTTNLMDVNQETAYGDEPGQLGTMPEGELDAVIGSPPFSTPGNQPASGMPSTPVRSKVEGMGLSPEGEYGQMEGNLGNMDFDDYDAVVTSPPFHSTLLTRDEEFIAAVERDQRNGSRFQTGSIGKYGDEDGQLGEMPAGDLNAVITSPPYIDSINDIGAVGDTPAMRQQIDNSTRRKDSYGTTDGQLGTMPEGNAIISSPPFSPPGNQPTGQGQGVRADYEAGLKKHDAPESDYGGTEGQLGTMDMADYDSVVSSPPFNENRANATHGETKGFHSYDENEAKSRMKRDYVLGETEGNLGVMPLEAAISSPPFESTEAKQDTAFDHPDRPMGAGAHAHYGDTDGNIGNEMGETFWSAAYQIVDQCYTALRPGAVTAWVCKDFIRKGEKVPFADQWQELCIHVGFEPVERARAWVIDRQGVQLDIFGNEIVKQKEYKSFFRRLAEERGSPRIDWEDVIILRKPEDEQIQR